MSSRVSKYLRSLPLSKCLNCARDSLNCYYVIKNKWVDFEPKGGDSTFRSEHNVWGMFSNNKNKICFWYLNLPRRYMKNILTFFFRFHDIILKLKLLFRRYNSNSEFHHDFLRFFTTLLMKLSGRGNVKFR